VLLHVLLGRALVRQGKFVEAEEVLNAAWSALSKGRRRPPAVSRQAFDAMIELYESWAKVEPSAELAAKASDWRNARNDIQETSKVP